MQARASTRPEPATARRVAAGATLLLLVPLLLASVPATPATSAPAWSNDASPGNALVWGLGGSSEVLVASTVGRGTYQSFDNGRHWQEIPGFPIEESRSIAFDPNDPLEGYVAGYGGIMRTLDGGATWEHIVQVRLAQRLDVSPTGRLAATIEDPEGYNHVFVSDDRGETWTDLGAVFGWLSSAYGVAFGRTDDEIVAMDISNTYVTHDGGATWTRTAGGGVSLARGDDGAVWRSGPGALMKSTDGGLTWVDMGVNGWPLAPRPGGGLFASSADGVLVTKDGGATWTNMGYGDWTFANIGLLADPENPDAVFLGDEFHAILYVGPDGQGGYALETRTAGFPPVEIAAVGGSADASLLLAAGPSGVYASRDRAASWHHTGVGGGFIGLFSVAANADGSVAYAGGQNRVFQPFVLSSRDGGVTWAWHGFDNGGDGMTLGLAVHPNDPLRAYAAVWGQIAASHVFQTLDGGLTWTSIYRSSERIYDVAWDDAFGGLLVATDMGVVSLTEDGDPTGVRSVAVGGARAVATAKGVAYAGGTGSAVWRSVEGLPLLAPWSDAMGRAVDLAADPLTGASAWATLADGRLLHCASGAGLAGLCEDVTPAPGAMESAFVLPDGSGVLAAGGPTGIWKADL